MVVFNVHPDFTFKFKIFGCKIRKPCLLKVRTRFSGQIHLFCGFKGSIQIFTVSFGGLVNLGIVKYKNFYNF